MSVSRGTRIGSYEVIALLGKGGMGEVYRTKGTRLDRDVAINRGGDPTGRSCLRTCFKSLHFADRWVWNGFLTPQT